MGNKLPEGWTSCPLKDVVSSRKGKKPATVIDHEKKGYDPYLLIDELEGKPARAFTNDPKVPRAAKEDVLLVWDGSIGKCASGISGAVGSTIVVLSPKNELNTKFLEYFIRRSKNYILETSTGTGLQHINKNFLKTLEIPLPPEKQQKRIAHKLDALLAKVKDAQSRLDKIPTILGRFRQSVLAAAFSSELTKEWRKKNKCSEVTKLLKRNEYKIANEIELPDLPDSWMWGALGNYADCSRGRFSIRPRNDPRYYNGKYPFIQIGDLPREGGYINKHSQTLNDLGLSISKMFPKGTVTIAIVGATIANTGILGYDMCFPDSMVGIETGDEIRNRYCELFLRYKKHDIRQEAYSSGGQPNIKLQTLNPLPIAIAPAEEQVEVVKRVEHQLQIIDEFLEEYQHIKGYTDKLEQSILAKAFRGELVMQAK